MSEIAKERVSAWLMEEGFFYEEVADPDTRFNFNAKVAGLSLDIVQDISRDVIVVRSTLLFNETQMELFRGMGERKGKEYLWDVRLMLLGNSEISGFRIKPDPKCMEFLVHSRGIFGDALTKDRLMNSILTVHKAINMIVWTLNRQAGKVEPSVESTFYM
jgi:hypothetical protein